MIKYSDNAMNFLSKILAKARQSNSRPDADNNLEKRHKLETHFNASHTGNKTNRDK